jgi:hypothetical protein
MLEKYLESKQQSTQVVAAGAFGLVAPILLCEGPWKLFLPVALFMHNIHGPTTAICPWIHRVGYGDVILLFVTLF